MYGNQGYGDMIVLAAPANLPSTIREGVQQAVGQIVTGTFGTLLKVLGGLLIAVCLLILLWKYVAPQSQMFASMGQGQGGKRVIWIIAFLLLGVCMIAPAQILPWVGAAVGIVAQIVVNIIGILTGA